MFYSAGITQEISALYQTEKSCLFVFNQAPNPKWWYGFRSFYCLNTAANKCLDNIVFMLYLETACKSDGYPFLEGLLYNFFSFSRTHIKL